jgi:hypothetical protein
MGGRSRWPKRRWLKDGDLSEETGDLRQPHVGQILTYSLSSLVMTGPLETGPRSASPLGRVQEISSRSGLPPAGAGAPRPDEPAACSKSTSCSPDPQARLDRWRAPLDGCRRWLEQGRPNLAGRHLPELRLPFEAFAGSAIAFPPSCSRKLETL